MSQKIIIKICAGIMTLSGLTILFSTLFPILSYEWEASQKYPILISPLVEEETATFKFDNQDTTKLSSWFDTDSRRDFVTQNIKYYTLSIPKLNIQSATVQFCCVLVIK